MRKDDALKQLEDELKSKHNLNSSKDSFFTDLEKLIEEMKPMVYIDYVGGSLAGKIFKMMPRGSELVVLGDLAHEQL